MLLESYEGVNGTQFDLLYSLVDFAVPLRLIIHLRCSTIIRGLIFTLEPESNPAEMSKDPTIVFVRATLFQSPVLPLKLATNTEGN